MENLWWKLKNKLVPDKTDLSSTIPEIWKQLNEKYCFSLVLYFKELRLSLKPEVGSQNLDEPHQDFVTLPLALFFLLVILSFFLQNLVII